MRKSTGYYDKNGKEIFVGSMCTLNKDFLTKYKEVHNDIKEQDEKQESKIIKVLEVIE
jgi:hypothetical protein